MSSTIPAPKDAVLAPGSLILVTGVTSYIGSHTTNELLKRGYHVRGVVRSSSRAAWLHPFFDERYGAGKYTSVEIPEMKEGALTPEIMKGVAGIVHVASDVSFSPDPNVVIPTAVELINVALRAAAATPTVKRFVVTSSSAAVVLPTKNDTRTLTEWMFNDVAIELAQRAPPYEPERGLYVYSASKALAEKSMWDFSKTHTDVVFNSVLPDYTVGAPLSVENQNFPSTVGFAAFYFLGNEKVPRTFMQPQNYVNVVDVSLLHVAALLSPAAKGERVFGFAGPRTWNRITDAIKELYPDRNTGLGHDEDEGDALMVIEPRDRAEELLKWINQGQGWKSLTESIKEVGDIVIEAEKQGKVYDMPMATSFSVAALLRAG